MKDDQFFLFFTSNGAPEHGATLSTTNPTWTDPGIEPGPPRWEAGDWPPEPWHVPGGIPYLRANLPVKTYRAFQNVSLHHCLPFIRCSVCDRPKVKFIYSANHVEHYR
jgi:hypothetical protein